VKKERGNPDPSFYLRILWKDCIVPRCTAYVSVFLSLPCASCLSPVLTAPSHLPHITAVLPDHASHPLQSSRQSRGPSSPGSPCSACGTRSGPVRAGSRACVGQGHEGVAQPGSEVSWELTEGLARAAWASGSVLVSRAEG
jgi:hypothetical protein